MEIIVVFCTFPSHELARQIGTTLVEAQLAACVNLCPSVESIYRWQGKVESGREVLAMIKTTAATYPQLEARLKELHPYEVPEIIALPAAQVLPAYARGFRNRVSASSDAVWRKRHFRERAHHVGGQGTHPFKDAVAEFAARFIGAAEHLQLGIDVVDMMKHDCLRVSSAPRGNQRPVRHDGSR